MIAEPPPVAAWYQRAGAGDQHIQRIRQKHMLSNGAANSNDIPRHHRRIGHRRTRELQLPGLIGKSPPSPPPGRQTSQKRHPCGRRGHGTHPVSPTRPRSGSLSVCRLVRHQLSPFQRQLSPNRRDRKSYGPFFHEPKQASDSAGTRGRQESPVRLEI